MRNRLGSEEFSGLENNYYNSNDFGQHFDIIFDLFSKFSNHKFRSNCTSDNFKR